MLDQHFLECCEKFLFILLMFNHFLLRREVVLEVSRKFSQVHTLNVFYFFLEGMN